MYRLKSPLSAQMELTDACNNACLHCYNYWRYLESGQRLDSDTGDRSLSHFEQMLRCLIEKEVRSITFTGGEPFLRRDILFSLIQMAKASGLKAGVNTNAALIKPEDIRRLREVDADYVLVSLLSGQPGSHDFIANSRSHARTSRAISLMVESGVYVAVNMVVSAHNWNQVRETAMYVKNLGVSEFSATPVLPCPLAKEHSDLLLDSSQVKSVLDDLLWAKDNGMTVDVLEPLVHCVFTAEERTRFAQFLSNRSCSAGISDMVISPDGDVRPCILAIESCGNLINDGWDACWNSLAGWCSPTLLPETCLSCAVVDFCGGGCRVAALATSGNISGNDPYMTGALAELEIQMSEPEPSPTLDDRAKIVVRDGTSIRREEFGCVLFCGKRFMFLDHDGTEFMSYLLHKGTFSVSSIMEDLAIDRDELREFLSAMVDKQFLALNPKEGD